MIFAQSLVEYGGSSGLMAQLVRAVESSAQWVQLSLREDRPVWIGVGICVVLVLWLSRRG
jgi:hypothetical protein